MYFDGASHKEGAGAGVVFSTSEGEVLPYSFTLTQNCSNNVAEYQALILGLEIVVDAKQLPLKVYGDSQLVVNQLLGLYEVKKPGLLPYHNYAKKLMGWLGDIELEHLPRKDNKQADALAKLASTLSMTDKEAHIPICKSWVIPPIFSDDVRHVPRRRVSRHGVPLKEVKKENVVDFIRTHIIYRYGVPRSIITDNGKPFCNSLIDKLCKKFGFKQRNSSMYYVAANGLAEAFNKTLCNLLKKVVAKSKRDWHERIGEALWAYRTTIRTPTQATPYALVYGVEAVLPLVQQIPSLRIAIQAGLTEEENAQIRLEELEVLDEKKLEAQQRLECYQARLSRAFNKNVRLHSF
ncbi:hypothetical protein Sango_2491600 [Sesamum angolense]|uniref:Uncharacterized protein n=1 Tax=Sesamum angolense TaxID=2727404 RepID=A0AAE2BI48_9LAMI|nr:hypothetical protein Sango_2491600 [Sesamum angolense]